MDAENWCVPKLIMALRRFKWILRWISNDSGQIGHGMAEFCGSPTSAEIIKPAKKVVDQSRSQCFAINLMAARGHMTNPMSRPKPPQAVAERPVFTWGWACAHNHT